MAEIKTLAQLLDALSHGYQIQGKNEEKTPLPCSATKQEKEERHFSIQLAGRVFAVNSLYSEVYSLCRGYLCETEPEVQITIKEADIAYERLRAGKEQTYNSSYLETLAVYRKISGAMISFDTFLMHGAVIAIGNSAYMFTAESGTGKTTHIRKWLDRLGNAYVVNGDKPFIKMTEKGPVACGTPWCGKEQMGTNTMVPLKAIVFMERGEDNEIEEISFQQAFVGLLRQTYHPDTSELMRKTLMLLSQLNGKVQFFRFIFNNMKADAFDVAYQALTGEQT